MSFDYTFSADNTKKDPDKIKSLTKWLCEIDASQKAYRGWKKEAKDILEIYMNGHVPDSIQEKGKSPVSYNIVWMTQETVKEAIYARTPNTLPILRQGHETLVTKCAQLMAQRNIDYFVKSPDGEFDYNMRAARDDYLLIAQGQVWLNYKPTNEKEYVHISDDAKVEGDEDVYEDGDESYVQKEFLKGEDVEVQYIDWDDYLQEPARKWREVGWVAKRTYLLPEEVEEAFGEEIASQISYGSSDEPEDLRAQILNEKEKRCEIWEIWSKQDNKVYFISDQYKHGPLKEQEPPCQFKNFFPCPRPLLGTTINNSLVPVSDCGIMKFTINAIDEVTRRIGKLRRALKVFGIYDKSITELGDLFKDEDLYLHPSNNWTRFVENGKFDGALQFFPIGEYVSALQELNAEKQRLEQQYYSLSGYNSIMQSEAVINESAEARQVRSRFTDLRLSARQKEMQRFCRDAISLMAEVIFKKFEPETIKAISGISEQDNPEFTPEIQDAAIAFLKDEIARSLALEIETDSTLAISGEIERQDRLEFMNAAINSINMAVNVSDALPEFMEPATKMLTFTLDAYPAGQPLGMSINRSLEQYKQRKAQEAQQPPQMPIELQELQMKAQISQSEQQILMQKYMAEAQQNAQDAQMKFQIKQQELQFDYNKLQAENSLAIQKMQSDMQVQYQKIQGELMLLREKMMMEAQVKSQGQQMDAEIKVRGQSIDAEVKKNAHLLDAQLKAEKDMLDRQADIEKELIKSRAKNEEAMLKAQVEAAKVSQPEVSISPVPQQAPINLNITVDKGKGKKVGRINKETGEVLVEDVE